MSLINDALKKAQKQRTGEAPSLGSMPSVGGQSAASISRRSKPSGLNTLLLRGGIGAAVVLVLVVGGWFALRRAPEDRGQKTEDRAQASTQTTPPTVGSPLAGGPSSSPTVGSPLAGGPSPALSSPLPAPSSAQPAPAPAFTLQTAPVATPSSELPAPSSPARSSAPATSGNPQVSAPVQASAPPAVALKLEPRAMTFIDNLKVAGVRASPTDSKVLMNDRVYRLGDVVDHEMGLKLVGITNNSLTFEDEKGGRYTRNL